MPRGGREFFDRARGLWDRVTGGDDGPGLIQHQDAPNTRNHGFGGSRAAFREQQNAGGREENSLRTEFGGHYQGGQNRGPRAGGPRGGFTSAPQPIQPYHSGGLRGGTSARYDSGFNRGPRRGGMDYDRGWDDVGNRGFDPARMSGSGLGGIVENRGWGGEDEVRGGYRGDPRRDGMRDGMRDGYVNRHPGDTGYRAGRYERDLGPRGGYQGLRGNGFEGPAGGFGGMGGSALRGARGGQQGSPRGGMRTGYGADFGPRGRGGYDAGFRGGPAGPDLDGFGEGLRAMYSGTYNEGGVLGQTSNREFDVPEAGRQHEGGWQGRGPGRR